MRSDPLRAPPRGKSACTTGGGLYDAPLLAAPGDSALNQPTILTLGWLRVNGPASYRLQITADSTTFVDADVDTVIVDDGLSVDTVWVDVTGLAVSTTYRWRVRAEDAAGKSEWSDAWRFRTHSGEPKRYYYVKDHLGSVRVTVNEDGDVVQYSDYYPFGLEMPNRTSRERRRGRTSPASSCKGGNPGRTLEVAE